MYFTGPEEGEELRKINDTYYEISNLGRVLSNEARPKIMREITNHGGYKKVLLRTASGNKVLFVHRLVATAFKTKDTGADYVNHIDGNPANNNADNLEWVTKSANTKDGVKRSNGHWRSGKPTAVWFLDSSGKRLWFPSCGQAAKHIGKYTPTTVASIWAAASGKQKTFAGLTWGFLEK